MAEERIDIEVTDKGGKEAAKSLRDIASEAQRGAPYVERLQKALAAINSSPVERLARASASNSNALARELTAQSKLTAAQAAAGVAAARVATETQRLATETERTNAAQSRAAVAANAAAMSATKLAAAQAGAAGSAGNLAARAESMKRAIDPAYAAQARFNAEILEARTLLDAGAINMRVYAAAVSQAQARLDTATQAADRHTGAMGRQTNAGGRLAANNANLIAQFNDLGVQFSMAAQSSEPLKMVMMALIQQGSQIAYIAGQMDNGWKGVALSAGRLLLVLAPLIVAAGALYAVFARLNSQANEDSGLKEYTKTLGLTKKEMKELENVTVTMTDTLGATWEVLSETLLATMGTSTKEVSEFFSWLGDRIFTYMKAAFIGIGASVMTLVELMAVGTRNIWKLFYNAGVLAANLFLKSIEFLVNKTIDGINAIGGAINWLGEAAGFGKVVGEMGKVSFGISGLSDGMQELESFDVNGRFQRRLETTRDNIDAIGGAIDRVSKRRARDRLKKQADKIIEDRSDPRPKKDRKPGESPEEKRARALEMVNKQLDNELARMGMLSRERAVQERMDQIEESLLQKKIKLNDQERAALRAKVEEIERLKPIQQEMDRIYEDSIGPAEKLNASTEAAKILYDRGKISLEAYNQELAKAGRAYAEATDPLFSFREGLEAQERTMGLYGRALEQANYQEQIRQALVAKGFAGDELRAKMASAEVQALLQKNAALLQQQAIQSTIGNIVNPMLQDQQMLDNKALYYAEIERMRQADILSEQQAQRARYALDAQFNEMRLEGMRGFFGEMAGLASSGNRELAAIGKAAAVAQATIDGYVAVQKALASAPPPWNYAMAAAVALKTGAQVAGIMSTNVGSFKDGGQFTVGGRDGVDANNINMNVTKGERVTIETLKQQKANDNQKTGANVTVPVKVVNVRTPGEALAEMDSDEGEEIIFNRLANSPNRLAAIINGANG